jgi:hypothetical protein
VEFVGIFDLAVANVGAVVHIGDEHVADGVARKNSERLFGRCADIARFASQTLYPLFRDDGSHDDGGRGVGPPKTEERVQ